MAYKKKPKGGAPKPLKLSSESQAKKDLLERIRERSKVMIDADAENRRAAKADIKFVNVPGEQWSANMKQERGDRPCLESNTLRINGKRVINEIRANRPQGHVRPVEGGDKEGAQLREGLVRNILHVSDFDTITDQAAEYQVDGGFGAWRIDTQYASDSMFDQDIMVNTIKDPIGSLYWDPSCADILLKRDAEDWLLIKSMSVKAYEAKYPDAEQFDFESEGEAAEWEEDEAVRVVEYWYKEPTEKELWLVELPNPETGEPERLTVDSTSDEAVALSAQGITPIKTRKVRTHKIMMCVASGKSILEGPVEVGGSMFPFVVAFGEVKVVDGKVKWWGLHRFSKDAQQIQNVFWTAAAETVAGAPKAHTWATVDQAEGHLPDWAEAHRKNLPVRLYNHDSRAPGPPIQHPGAQVPVAMLEMVGLSGDLVRTTSGLHEASFGQESAEKSGVALARKQRQAQIVTYNFGDNMAKGAKRTGEIILDKIPIVYDADRELRVIGVDGAEEYKRINHLVFDPQMGKTIRVNDMTSGKYDYYVKPGPSFSSMREEASEVYGEFVQKFPDLMGVAGDLIFKASDLPYSDEIAKRMQTLLPPPIQKQLTEGKEVPAEARAVMAQAEQAMAMVQQQTQLVQQAAQEVQQDQATSEKAKAEVEKAIANLKTAEAQFEAKIAKAMADLSKRETLLQAKEIAHSQEKQDAEGLLSSAGEAREAVQSIDEMVAQFMEAMSRAVAIIDAKASTKRARVKGIRTERVNGVLVATPEYDGESDEPRIASVRAERGPDGSLMGVPEYEPPTVQ